MINQEYLLAAWLTGIGVFLLDTVVWRTGWLAVIGIAVMTIGYFGSMTKGR